MTVTMFSASSGPSDRKESQLADMEVDPKTFVREVLYHEASADEDMEPVYVIDMGEVVRKHRQWKSLLPRVEPFYAMKCNNDVRIVRTLTALGTGLDCASKNEIQMALDAGLGPDDIIYANPCKPISHLKFAKRVGVRLMTFDNEDELVKVAQHCPNARLVLRILTDDSYSVCRFGMKFGASAERVPGLLEKAKELGLDVVGISFHVGSGCYNADAFGDAVMRARHAFNVGHDLGFNFDFLDLGGGFPGNDDSIISFEEIARVLNEALALHFPPSTDVRIIAEPGRYYATSAYTLAVNVIAKRLVPPQKSGDVAEDNSREDSAVESAADSVSGSDVEDGEDDVPSSRSFVAESAPELAGDAPEAQPGFMYYVNDGAYGSFNCILYDHADPKPQVLMRDGNPHVAGASETTFAASLWGPTCDGLDCLTKEARLPQLHIGDWLYYDNMGAYTLAAGSCFNGFPRPRRMYINTEHSSTPAVRGGYDYNMTPIEVVEA